MTRLRRCLFVAFSLIGLSYQKDPIVDFCRRWGHQTAQVDGRLYIDGGMVDWSVEDANYTNTALLFSDLNSSVPGLGQPYQYANLSKPSNIPSVSGGILWPDEVNKCFYQFGGAFTNGTPTDFSMWTYDTLLDQWNKTGNKAAGVSATQRVAYGAGTHIEGLGLGFYFGGYKSNWTDPNWTGPAIATADLVRFEYSTGYLSNNSGPADNVGRAEGQLVYLPISDSGLLVYFGGIEDPQQNGTSLPEIHMYDVQSSKWYTQTATGDIPGARRQFCAGVTWANDQSSYNIYLYGGYGFGDPLAYDDVYILTLPSFTWIKAFPTDNSTGAFPHGGCSANVINKDQMIIIGGWFPDSDQCDSPQVQGQHGMNLGYNGERKALWDRYDPAISDYFVPTPIISAIGGGPTGGATKTAPASWDSPDLAVYYTLKAASVTRTATRALPSSTGTSSEGSSKSRVGAIAGGVVGGLAALIAILCLILFCLHRKKKSKKQEQEQPAELPPPVELGVTTPPQEMPAPALGKYIPLHQQQEQYSPYSGVTALHSPHSVYAQQSALSGSPPHLTPYGSPHDASYAQPAYPQSAHARSPSWEHAQFSTMDTRYSQQSHPSPPSPSHPSYAPPQEAQLYYPPPRETAYQTPMVSPAGYSGYDSRQYHDSASSPLSPPPASTMPTPTQFYARPAAVPGDGQSGYAQPPTAGERYGDSLEAQRRPRYGRFLEGDHT
ncbi:cell wall anchored protein [Stagonosporopsis vannaccii]|nr:cell wall anchored protein [Stagonosporopsis vannaccii]